MTNLINDLSILTTISRTSLEKLVNNSNWCISHNVLENLLEKNPLTSIDIGIGTLYIKLEDNLIKYKFTPSKALEDMVSSTVTSKQSPIVNELESNLKERIENTYKDLL